MKARPLFLFLLLYVSIGWAPLQYYEAKQETLRLEREKEYISLRYDLLAFRVSKLCPGVAR